MRRDLKNRIRRRIDDPVSRSKMLGTEFIDHFGSAGNNVSNDSSTGGRRETRDHILGKSVWISRKRFREMDAGDLPVTCRTVFSGRRRIHRAPGADRPIDSRSSLEGSNVSQSAHVQSRKIKSSDCMSEMSKSVAALIT